MGKVAYQLDLSDKLGQIHITFHVSQLRKCLVHESIVVHLDGIQLDEWLNYIKWSIMILDTKTNKLRNKEVGLVKVHWQYQNTSD